MTTEQETEQVAVERITASMLLNPPAKHLVDWMIQFNGQKYSFPRMQYLINSSIDRMNDREMFFLLSVFSSDMAEIYLRRVQAAQQGFNNVVTTLDAWFSIRNTFHGHHDRADIFVLYAAQRRASARLTAYCLKNGLFTDL